MQRRKRLLKKAVAVSMSWIMVLASLSITPKTVSAGVYAGGGNGGWSLVWSDEFDQAVGGGVDQGTWNYQTGAGGWGNNEVQNYTTSTNNVFIANVGGATDGKALAIRAQREGWEITSGRLMSEGKFYARYGRMEARIRMEGGMRNGVWPAFWMMGNQTGYGWPACGEIDIMEHRNSEREIIGTLHWNPTPGDNNHDNHVYEGSETTGQFGYVNSMDDWHTYRVDWYEDEIQFFLDGNWYETLNITDGNMEEFKRAHYFLLNVAIGSTSSPFTRNITVDADWQSSTMYVDYVRVYQGGDGAFQRNKTNRNGGGNEQAQTQAPSDGYTACAQDKNVNLGIWNYYVGSWAGATAGYKGGNDWNNFSMKVYSNDKKAWGIQAYTSEFGVENGATYRYRINVNSDRGCGDVLLKDDTKTDAFPDGRDLMTRGLGAGDNVFEGTVTAVSDRMKFFFNLQNVEPGTTLNFNSVTMEKISGGGNEQQQQTNAPTQAVEVNENVNYNDADFLGDGARGGELADTYKAVIAGGAITGVVNIQDKNGVAGIYTTLEDAVLGDIKINGEKKDEIVEGAGIWINVDHLNKRNNEVVFYNPDGSVKGVLRVMNVKINEDGSLVTTQAPTERQTDPPTQEPTNAPTEKQTEPPTQKQTDKPTETQKPTESQTQKQTDKTTTVPTTTKTSSQNPTTKQSVTDKATQAGTTASNENITQGQNDGTTNAVESTADVSGDNITTADEGSQSKTSLQVGKTKVKTAKKSKKAVKLKLKKVKSAVGYQISIFKSKKDAKKNKKPLVKKVLKKNKGTVKSKKLATKKTLYVRARAYRFVGIKKKYGKWSKPKKVK